jgi:hypothetical protein
MPKMDHRLMGEIQSRSQRAKAEGKTAQDLASEQYQVTVELERHITPRKGKTRTETIDDLKDQVQAHQASIVDALKSMGVADFQVLYLSNSIKASLTTDQIGKIMKHPDVKIVRLIQLEQVTT